MKMARTSLASWVVLVISMLESKPRPYGFRVFATSQEHENVVACDDHLVRLNMFRC